MFCPSCGTKLPDAASTCSNCGEVLRRAVASDGSLAKGFVVLITSFFTMPLRTLKLAGKQLRDIGDKGKLDIGATEIPHLTWGIATGQVFASVIAILSVVFGVIVGLLSLTKLNRSPMEALGGLIFFPILGILGAIFLDWITMYSIEVLSLWVSIANHMKKMADKN
jgi:hypothetical protein